MRIACMTRLSSRPPRDSACSLLSPSPYLCPYAPVPAALRLVVEDCGRGATRVRPTLPLLARLPLPLPLPPPPPPEPRWVAEATAAAAAFNFEVTATAVRVAAVVGIDAGVATCCRSGGGSHRVSSRETMSLFYHASLLHYTLSRGVSSGFLVRLFCSLFYSLMSSGFPIFFSLATLRNLGDIGLSLTLREITFMWKSPAYKSDLKRAGCTTKHRRNAPSFSPPLPSRDAASFRPELPQIVDGGDAAPVLPT